MMITTREKHEREYVKDYCSECKKDFINSWFFREASQAIGEKPAIDWVEFESVFDSKKCGFNKAEFSARRLEPHTHRDRDAITIHLRSKYPPFVSDMIAVYGTLAEVMDKIR